ncbi:PilW family protein [Virgibacillus kekensis]|uniref:PilW family protein n=1 Tax=Virgibacillus kekensis TaxID=202261 RepID=A0ABV9DF59_9BACI
MPIRHFYNQKGLTLVELLASISLFGIVIVLASSILFQSLDSEETTSNQISLSQNTNVLISELRNQYNQGETDLCFNESSNLTIKDYTIKNGESNLYITDNCINGVSNQKPLFIDLVATTQSGVSLPVKTTFSRQESYTLNITATNPDDFKEGNIEDCTFDENVKFNEEIIIKNKKNEVCKNKYNFNEHVAFMNGITIHNKVTIVAHKNFYLRGVINFKGSKGELCIKGKFERGEEISELVKETSTCFEPEGYSIYHITR